MKVWVVELLLYAEWGSRSATVHSVQVEGLEPAGLQKVLSTLKLSNPIYSLTLRGSLWMRSPFSHIWTNEESPPAALRILNYL